MQAVLIIAHKNPDQVYQLCERLRRNFNVYIHFDKKMNLTSRMKEQFDKIGVEVYSEFSINWSGYNMVRAELLLLHRAFKNLQNNFFHIISGEDWFVKDPQEIYNFYENHPNIYMTYDAAKSIVKSGENCGWWYRLYFNYDKINRRTFFGKIYHRIILWLQLLFRVNKMKKNQFDREVYCGSSWMDLPRDAVAHILKVLEENPVYEKIFSSSFCPDEAIFQTILVNSNFKDRITQDIHRYIVWENKHGTYPGILDEADCDGIQNGDYHFARKIDIQISKQLLGDLKVL